MYSAHHLLGPRLGSHRLPVTDLNLEGSRRIRQPTAPSHTGEEEWEWSRSCCTSYTLAALSHSSATSTILPTSQQPARPQSTDLLICLPSVYRNSPWTSWSACHRPPDLLAAGLHRELPGDVLPIRTTPSGTSGDWRIPTSTSFSIGYKYNIQNLFRLLQFLSNTAFYNMLISMFWSAVQWIIFYIFWIGWFNERKVPLISSRDEKNAVRRERMDYINQWWFLWID
jgi:hypothetical protein